MKSSNGTKPESIISKFGQVQKYQAYEEMDNDGNERDEDEAEHENSIHADIGGQYTERKIALANDTEIEMHPQDNEEDNDQQMYMKLDNRLESEAGRFSHLNQTDSHYDTHIDITPSRRLETGF